MPSMHSTTNSSSWNEENTFTGKVTCSVPFCEFFDCLLASHSILRVYTLTVTSDGRGLVAIGCAEGVWIGLRHDPRCE